MLEQLIRAPPQLVYLIPTFGNPSGATLSLERADGVLELAASTGTLVVRDDPYGELYFDQPPPPRALLARSAAGVPGSRNGWRTARSFHARSSARACGWAGLPIAPRRCWPRPPCANSSATPIPAT